MNTKHIISDYISTIRSDLEAALEHTENALTLLSKPTTPPTLKPVRSVSFAAYQTRLNALLFDGQMNSTQRNCIAMFTIALRLLEMSGREIYPQFLACMIANIYHETAFTMKSIAEYGKGAGHEYGEPDERTGQTYYGRSYPQLTWYDNYLKASKLIYTPNLRQGVDIVNNPDKVLAPFYGVQVMVFGMLEGWFTGKKLSDYLSADGTFDYYNSRRIINGTDRASTIAGYGQDIETAIRLAMGEEIERPLLVLGSKGSDVCELQLALNDGLDLNINPDGILGNNTQQALIEYQQNHELTADGKCGAATWRSIEQAIYGLERPE